MESEEYREESSSAKQNPANEQSLSQTEAIELLRGTMRKLEEIANRLETEPVANFPAASSLETLLATTEELAAAIEVPKTEPAKPVTKEQIVRKPSQKTKLPSQPETVKVVSEPENNLPLSWVDRILNSIRSLLPRSVNNLLSDWALIGIVSAIVIVLSVTSVILIPESSSEIERVSQTPSTSVTPKTSTSETSIPESETITSQTNQVEAEAETEVETTIPSELIAPKPSQTIQNLPTPEPKLTPEQSLIASIQEKISNITDRYSEDLIVSIEADFPQSFLLVKVSDSWYQLNQNRQNKIANEILENSRLLDFKRLEIVDPEEALIARNPVVGKEIIILQRIKTVL
jgi:hypothetical protein